MLEARMGSTVAWIERSLTGYVFEGLVSNVVVFFGTFVGPLEDGTELGGSGSLYVGFIALSWSHLFSLCFLSH